MSFFTTFEIFVCISRLRKHFQTCIEKTSFLKNIFEWCRSSLFPWENPLNFFLWYPPPQAFTTGIFSSGRKWNFSSFLSQSEDERIFFFSTFFLTWKNSLLKILLQTEMLELDFCPVALLKTGLLFIHKFLLENSQLFAGFVWSIWPPWKMD